MTRSLTVRSCAILAQLLAIAALALAGCGGDDKRVEEPAVVQDDEPPPPEEDVLIPPEKTEAIERAFTRKGRIVGRCFAEAIDAGEIDRNAKGQVTVYTRITTDGKPTKIKIVKASHRSDTLWSCVTGLVESWKFTTLPKHYDYTHSFRFDTL